MFYTIGQMSAMTGVPASTLRYYDKEGLLPFVERSGETRAGLPTPITPRLKLSSVLKCRGCR